MSFDKGMTIREVLEKEPKTVDVFLSFGMHCVGCPTASGETIEQAAAVHGINLDLLMDKLNEVK